MIRDQLAQALNKRISDTREIISQSNRAADQLYGDGKIMAYKDVLSLLAALPPQPPDEEPR